MKLSVSGRFQNFLQFLLIAAIRTFKKNVTVIHWTQSNLENIYKEK